MLKLSGIHKQENDFVNRVGYLIFYIMIGLVPHIYKYTVFTSSESESVYFKELIYADLYMLTKSRVLLLLAIVLLGVFVYQIMHNKIQLIRDKIFIGTGLAAVIIIVSSVMSPYQDLVYWGAKDRFEGMWIWLAYLLVFTVSRHYGSNKEFVERLLRVFVLSASFMAVFGLMQIYGYDIYTEGPLRWLCFPREIAKNITQYMLTNTTETLAVGALYNSNYFGVYSAVAAMGGVIFFLKGGLSNKIVFGSAIVLNYGAMIASRSEAALLGMSVSLLVMFLSNGRELWKNKLYVSVLGLAIFLIDRRVVDVLIGNQSENARYIYILMLVMILFGSILCVLLTKVEWISKFVKKQSFLLGIITVFLVILGFNVAYKYVPISENSNLIESLTLKNNLLLLKMKNDEGIRLEFLATGINAYDGNGQMIDGESLSQNAVSLKTNNEIYQVEFNYYSNGYVATLKRPIEFNVFYDGNSIAYVDKITGVGGLDYPERFEYYFKNGNAFSKRGYIWATYMPVMKEHLLLGSGFETYINLFPQNDFVGKYNAYTNDYKDMIVDKPHSMYIMVGLAAGGGGLALFILWIISLLSHYYKFPVDSLLISSLMSMISVIVISGIFNDSVIPISVLMFSFGGYILSSLDKCHGEEYL